jgi:hypothetical protein
LQQRPRKVPEQDKYVGSAACAVEAQRAASASSIGDAFMTRPVVRRLSGG